MRIVANSQWFLDPEAWECLANELVPQLLQTTSRLRLWSAGCFTGKEPFSTAVLLMEGHPDLEWSMLATDCDPAAVAATRRRGPFSARDIENVPADWQERHLEPGLPAFARDHLLDRMQVAEHDLLRDPFPSHVNVILYRNMETCFSEEENAAIWTKFGESLVPGGVVFVGAVDRLPREAASRFVRLGPCFYRRAWS